MEYKTPKVLERKPIVGGFNLKVVIIIVGCSLLFLFTVYTNFFISLIFPAIAVTFVYMEKKYPGKGELLKVISYQAATKCIHVDRDITQMIVKKIKEPTTEIVENKEENTNPKLTLRTSVDMIIQKLKLNPPKIQSNTNQNVIANEQK